MVLFTDFVKRRLSCRRRTGRKPTVPVRKFPLDEDLAIKAKLTMPPVTIDVPELCAVYVGAGIAQNQKKKPRVELKLYPHHFRLTLEKRADWYPYVQMHSVYTVKKKSALGIVYKQNDGTYLCVCLKIKYVKKQRRFRRNNVKITGEEVKRVILERLNRQEIEGVPKWEPPQGFQFSESDFSLINDEESLSEIYTNDEGESLSDFEPSQLNNDSRPCPSHGRRHPPVHREDSLTHTNSDRPEGFPNCSSDMPRIEDTICEPPVLRSMSHLSVRVPCAGSEGSLLSYSDAESNVLSSYYDDNDELSASSLSISSSVYSLCSEIELFDEMIEAQRNSQGSQNSTETLAESDGSTENAVVATEHSLVTMLPTEAIAAAPEKVLASKLVADTVTAASERVVASKLVANAIAVAVQRVSVSNLCVTENATEDTEHSTVTLCLPEYSCGNATAADTQAVALCSQTVNEEPSKDEQTVVTKPQSEDLSNEAATDPKSDGFSCDHHSDDFLNVDESIAPTDPKELAEGDQEVVRHATEERLTLINKESEQVDVPKCEPPLGVCEAMPQLQDSHHSTETLAESETFTEKAMGPLASKLVSEAITAASEKVVVSKLVANAIAVAVQRVSVTENATEDTEHSTVTVCLPEYSSGNENLCIAADTQAVALCSQTVNDELYKDEQTTDTEQQSEDLSNEAATEPESDEFSCDHHSEDFLSVDEPIASTSTGHKQFATIPQEPLATDASDVTTEDSELFASDMATNIIVAAKEQLLAASLASGAIASGEKWVEASDLDAKADGSDGFSNDHHSNNFFDADKLIASADHEQLAERDHEAVRHDTEKTPTLTNKETEQVPKCEPPPPGMCEAMPQPQDSHHSTDILAESETFTEKAMATEEPFASKTVAKAITAASERVMASKLIANAIAVAVQRVSASNLCVTENATEDTEHSTVTLCLPEFSPGNENLATAGDTQAVALCSQTVNESFKDEQTVVIHPQSEDFPNEATTVPKSDEFSCDHHSDDFLSVDEPIASTSTGHEQLATTPQETLATDTLDVTTEDSELFASDMAAKIIVAAKEQVLAASLASGAIASGKKRVEASEPAAKEATEDEFSDDDYSNNLFNVDEPLIPVAIGEPAASKSLSQESHASDTSKGRDITELHEPPTSKLDTSADHFALKLATEIIVAAKEDVLSSQCVTDEITTATEKDMATNIAANGTLKATEDHGLPNLSSSPSGDSHIKHISVAGTQAVALCSHTVSEEPLASSKDEYTLTESQSDKDFCVNNLVESVRSTVLSDENDGSDPLCTKESLAPVVFTKGEAQKPQVQEATLSRTYAQVVSETKVNIDVIVNEGDSSKVQEATQSPTYAQVVSGTNVNIDVIGNEGDSLCKSGSSHEPQWNGQHCTRHGCPKDKPESEVSPKELPNITVAAKGKLLASKPVKARNVVDTNFAAEAKTKATAEFSLPADASSGDSLVEHLSVAGTQAVALCSHTVSAEPLASSKDEHTHTEPQSDEDFIEAASQGCKSQNDSFSDLGKTVRSTVLSDPLCTIEPLTPVAFTEQFAFGELPACRSQHLTSDISPDKDVIEGTLSSDICTENVIAKKHPTSKFSCAAVKPQLLDNAQTPEIVRDAMTMNRDQYISADSTSFQFEAWFPETLGRPIDEEGPESDNLKNSAEVEDLESDPSIAMAVFEAPGITPEEVASKKKVIIKEPTEKVVTGEPLNASHPCPAKDTAEEPSTPSTSKSNNATVESLLQFCYNYMDKKQKPEKTVPDTMAAKDQKPASFRFVERLISYARCPDSMERDVTKEKVVTEEPLASDSLTKIIAEEPLMSFQPQKLDSRPCTRHGHHCKDTQEPKTPKEHTEFEVQTVDDKAESVTLKFGPSQPQNESKSTCRPCTRHGRHKEGAEKPDIKELSEARVIESLQEPGPFQTQLHSRPCTRRGRSTTVSKEETQKPKEATQSLTYAQVVTGTKVNIVTEDSLGKSGPSQSQLNSRPCTRHGRPKDKPESEVFPKKPSEAEIFNEGESLNDNCKYGPSKPQRKNKPRKKRGRGRGKKPKNKGTPKKLSIPDDGELMCESGPSQPENDGRPRTRHGPPKEDVNIEGASNELSKDKRESLSKSVPSQPQLNSRPRTRHGRPMEEPEPEIKITPKIISGAEVYTVDEEESHEMDFDASTYPGMDMNVDWDVPQREPSYADQTTSSWYSRSSDQYTQNWDQDSYQYTTGYVPGSEQFFDSFTRCSQDDTQEEGFIPHSDQFDGMSSQSWNQNSGQYSDNDDTSDESTSPITCGYDENDEFVWPTPGPNGMMELVKDTLYATKEDGEYFLHTFRRSSNGETTMITQPYTNIRKERAEYEKQNPVIIEELS